MNSIQFSQCLQNLYYLSRAVMAAEETKIEHNPYIQIIYNLKSYEYKECKAHPRRKKPGPLNEPSPNAVPTANSKSCPRISWDSLRWSPRHQPMLCPAHRSFDSRLFLQFCFSTLCAWALVLLFYLPPAEILDIPTLTQTHTDTYTTSFLLPAKVNKMQTLLSVCYRQHMHTSAHAPSVCSANAELGACVWGRAGRGCIKRHGLFPQIIMPGG